MRRFGAVAIVGLLVVVPVLFPLDGVSAQAVGPSPIPELELFLRLSRRAPDNPGLMTEIAARYARAGDTATAVIWLARAISRGLDPGPRDLEPFARFSERREVKDLLRAADAAHLVRHSSEVAWTVDDRELVPEGLAYDPVTGDFFLSSVSTAKILRIDRGGHVADFVSAGRDGLWSVLGLAVDAPRRVLWACSMAGKGYGPLAGRSALFKFDLRTGRLLARLDAKTPGSHLFNDVAVAGDGGAFVTDTEAHQVLRVPPNASRLEAVTGSRFVMAPNGLALAPDQRHLFVAEMYNGITLLDVQTGRGVSLRHARSANLAGIDGLYFDRGRLVAVQNAAGVERVVCYRLSRDLEAVTGVEVLESHSPQLVIPTTGAVVGDAFYYIGNSQLDALDDNGRVPSDRALEPIHIMRTPLPAAGN